MNVAMTSAAHHTVRQYLGPVVAPPHSAADQMLAIRHNNARMVDALLQIKASYDHAHLRTMAGSDRVKPLLDTTPAAVPITAPAPTLLHTGIASLYKTLIDDNAAAVPLTYIDNELKTVFCRIKIKDAKAWYRYCDSTSHTIKRCPASCG